MKTQTIFPILSAGIIILIGLVGLAGTEPLTPPAAPDSPTTGPETRSRETEEFYKQINTIFNLLEKMENQDETEREDAFARLVELGQPVIPFLAERLKNKGIYVELTRRIMEQHPVKETVITPAVLEELSRRVLKDESLLVEKYLYGKYLAALDFVQRERYEDAIKLVNSILLLEPQIPFSAKLKQLRISCEEKIIQKKVIRTKMATGKTIYEQEDKINIGLEFENVTLEPVDIAFGAGNSAIIYLTITEYQPEGNEASISRPEEVKLSEEKITLKPQETWRQSFTIDTAKEPRSLFYRVYTLGAEIRPLKIEGGREFESIRKIVFPQLTLRVFPPDVDPVLKEPLAKLGEALDGGIPLDIFLCALLVPPEQYEQAVEMLMATLQKSPPELKKVLMNTMKHITRLPFALEEEVWLKWWKEKNKQ